MSFLHLPHELLLHVVSFLESERDVNHLSQVNKQFYLHFNPYLYWLNSRTSNSAIFWAARHGKKETARMSIKEGCQVRMTDHSGRTPLFWAAYGGHVPVVKVLLETGQVDVDSKDPGGWTPLAMAAQAGHVAVVKLLLETGQVHPDSKDSEGWTALTRAAQFGHEAVVTLLLESGRVTVDSRDSEGWTPLTWAMHCGHETVARLLLDADQLTRKNFGGPLAKR